MSSTVDARDPESDRLRADYYGAFHEWAVQVSLLQAIGEGISEGVEEAETRVAAAEVHYRDSRDRLTEAMLLRDEIPARQS